MANLRTKMSVSIDGVRGKYKIESPSRFCKRHKGLSVSALRYLRDNDLIDFYKDGHTVLVVLTKKTLAYKPKLDKRRSRTQAR